MEKVNHAPPPLNKQLLAGKWKNVSEVLIVAGYDFLVDGTFTMRVKGMEQPVPGYYSWIGERTLELDYTETPVDIKQAYKEAAKAYKEGVSERVQAGELFVPAGRGLIDSVRDKLPATEAFQVGISEQPRLLSLTPTENGVRQSFEKAD
jgi:hypothetical protein